MGSRRAAAQASVVAASPGDMILAAPSLWIPAATAMAAPDCRAAMRRDSRRYSPVMGIREQLPCFRLAGRVRRSVLQSDLPVQLRQVGDLPHEAAGVVLQVSGLWRPCASFAARICRCVSTPGVRGPIGRMRVSRLNRHARSRSGS